jgi:hypothetical protein
VYRSVSVQLDTLFGGDCPKKYFFARRKRKSAVDKLSRHRVVHQGKREMWIHRNGIEPLRPNLIHQVEDIAGRNEIKDH